MPIFGGNKDLCKLGKEYLNDLLCKFNPFCLQHSKTFDISHEFLRVTIAELSMLKQVRFFLAHPVDIDKRKTAFTTTIDSTSNAAKMVKLGSQTIKFCCVISNHPRSTLHLLHMYMLMSGVRATWLCCKRNFNLLTVFPIGLMRRATLRWALPHIHVRLRFRCVRFLSALGSNFPQSHTNLFPSPPFSLSPLVFSFHFALFLPATKKIPVGGSSWFPV